MDRAARMSGQLQGHERRVTDEWVVVIGGEQHAVTVVAADDGYQVTYADNSYQVSTEWAFGQPLLHSTINGKSATFQVERSGLWLRLFHRGNQIDALVLTPRAAELHSLMPEKEAPDLSKFLLSPMPGLLVKVSVVEGQEVKAGEELAVVEAMKMENVLRASQDGVVASVKAEAGDSLKVDQVIIEFE
jgi:propionyl-CoA carboxylase alpha chain